MAYTTGTAADITAVRTALVSACVAEGWIQSGNVIYKGGCYVELIGVTDGDDTRLTVRAQSDLAGTSIQPTESYIGRIWSGISPTFNHPLIFPMTYHSFVFDNEVFFVVSFEDKYQYISFGQSQQAGLLGTGNWSCASAANRATSSVVNRGIGYLLTDLSWASYPDAGGYCPIFNFYAGIYFTSSSVVMLDHGLDANNWRLGAVATGTSSDAGGISVAGAAYIKDLALSLPNAFNDESVLLPIRAYKRRAESKFSQVLELTNARICRVDNYASGEILTLGPDQWMVFPFYRKNVPARNGSGSSIDHTGTMGWAIRYEGA